MKKIYIFGYNKVSLFIAKKFLALHHSVKILLNDNLPIPKELSKLKFIEFGSIKDFQLDKIEPLDILFLCEKPDGIADFFVLINPNTIIIDSVPYPTVSKYLKELEDTTLEPIIQHQLIKAFTNIRYTENSSFEINNMHETFFCTNNTSLIKKFNSLSAGIGIKAIYSGLLKNERHLLSLRILESEIQKNTYPDRNFSFSSKVY